MRGVNRQFQFLVTSLLDWEEAVWSRGGVVKSLHQRSARDQKIRSSLNHILDSEKIRHFPKARRRKRLESQLFATGKRRKKADGWPKQEVKAAVSQTENSLQMHFWTGWWE